MTKSFLRDACERVIATYIQAFLGLLLAGWSTSVDISTVQAAAVAAIPAALAVVMTMVARFVGDPESASLVGDVE